MLQLHSVSEALEAVTNAVLGYYGVTKEQLMTRKRDTTIVVPRQVFFYLAHEYTRDFRCKATVLAKYLEKPLAAATGGIYRIADLIKVDESLRRDLSRLRGFIENPALIKTKGECNNEQGQLIRQLVQKMDRPPAEYSNRDISKIHDYYESIHV